MPQCLLPPRELFELPLARLHSTISVQDVLGTMPKLGVGWVMHVRIPKTGQECNRPPTDSDPVLHYLNEYSDIVAEHG